MKKIVGIFKPLQLKQKIFVYEDGNKIESVEVLTKDIENTIFGLIEKYDIEKVDLTGPKQYVRGIVKHLEETKVVKYNKQSITFNII